MNSLKSKLFMVIAVFAALFVLVPECKASAAEKTLVRYFEQSGKVFDAKTGETADVLWGYKDSKGKVVIKAQFFQEFSFVDGVALVRTADGWRIIDTNGKYVSDKVIKNIVELYNFSDGRAISREKSGAWDEYYYLIDQKGNKVTKEKYTMMFRNQLGTYNVTLEPGGAVCKRGVIDKDGKVIIKPTDGYSITVTPKGYIVSKNANGVTLTSYVNKAGKTIVKFGDQVLFEVGDFVWAGKNTSKVNFHEYTVYNSKGKKVASVDGSVYEYGITVDDTVVGVANDGKKEYYNANGKKTLDKTFGYGTDVENGVFAAGESVLKGVKVYNTKGDVLLTLNDGEIVSLASDGYFTVVSRGTTALYDNKGNLVLKAGAKYDMVSLLTTYNPYSKTEKHLFLVWKNGKVGLVDKKGKEVIKPQFKSIEFTGNPDYVEVVSDKGIGYYSVKGKKMLDCKYVLGYYNFALNYSETGATHASYVMVKDKNRKYSFYTTDFVLMGTTTKEITSGILQ